MILKSKICGISDTDTLYYITNHDNPPQFVGFIVNYPKSNRYVELKKLKELLKIQKNSSFYVAVLVNPNHDILEKIKDLPFDYYQLYDCDPIKTKLIKEKYKKKIITAITVSNKEDVMKHKLFLDMTDIFLRMSRFRARAGDFSAATGAPLRSPKAAENGLEG